MFSFEFNLPEVTLFNRCCCCCYDCMSVNDAAFRWWLCLRLVLNPLGFELISGAKQCTVAFHAVCLDLMRFKLKHKTRYCSSHLSLSMLKVIDKEKTNYHWRNRFKWSAGARWFGHDRPTTWFIRCPEDAVMPRHTIAGVPWRLCRLDLQFFRNDKQ